MTTRRRPRGFSLIEVTLAIGVAAFCLIALFGLLPVGVASNQTTLAQTTAAGMAASIFADLRATPIVFPDPTTDPVSPRFAIPIPSNSSDTKKEHTIFLHDDGTAAIASTSAPSTAVDMNADLTQNPRYRVTLTFYPPIQTMLPTPAPGASPTPSNVPIYRAATTVRVLVTWPAIADQNALIDPSRYSGSFETVTALDRH